MSNFHLCCDDRKIVIVVVVTNASSAVNVLIAIISRHVDCSFGLHGQEREQLAHFIIRPFSRVSIIWISKVTTTMTKVSSDVALKRWT
jgi:hypothetical protein